MNSLRKVTDKNRLEFHVDKVDDFGAEVECLVKNVVGEVISATIIPGSLTIGVVKSLFFI